MPSPRLLTIILNFKTADMTLRSAEAALREMEGVDGEILIVDNDSQDGSYELLRDAVAERGWDADKRVRVVASSHNGGFGAGNNFGIRQGLSDSSAPDYVYVLNSDAFPDPGSIKILMETLEARPEAGFVGSYIHGPEGEPHTTCFRYPTFWSELQGPAKFGPITRLLKNYVVPRDIPQTTEQVDWLAGASLMMRQAVLDEIGLFDETFFLYFEEADLCRRAQLAGWSTLYVRASEITHIGGASTGSKVWARTPTYWFDSRLYYFSKNHGRVYAALATFMHLIGGGLWRLRCLVTNKPTGQSRYFLRDMIWHAVRNGFAIKPKSA